MKENNLYTPDYKNLCFEYVVIIKKYKKAIQDIDKASSSPDCVISGKLADLIDDAIKLA